jgi:glycosyltransferase involved in cell wall biosynthesis
MKIALYVPSWPPGFVASGIVTYASRLVPTLRQLGHEVFVLTPNKLADDTYTIDLSAFVPLVTNFRRAMSKIAPTTTSFSSISNAIFAAVKYLIAKHQIDVLEIEESFGLSLRVSRSGLLPVVVRLHGPWFLRQQFSDFDNKLGHSFYRRRLEGIAIQASELVTSPSAQVLQCVRDNYKLDLVGSRVIPNPADAVDEAHRWDSTTRNQNLLYVGRFDKMKGGDSALLAFAELASLYPELTLTFVGPDHGIRSASGQVLTLNSYIRANLPAYRSRIDFRGSMNQADVMSLRAKSFLTLVASRHETTPYSVLEPMSIGCPIVATAVGGIPELIRDQLNGLLVPAQDVKGLVAACQRSLENRAWAARLGYQAWLDCVKFYASSTIAAQTVQAYEEAIEKFSFKRQSRRPIIPAPR